jgi:hypothetical protein
MRARARLVPAGQAGTDPDGDETPIIDGDVQLDATAKIRGTAELTTTGAWPSSASSPLAPFGQELFLERGLTFGNGITEWVSLGYFRLEDTEQEVPAGTIRLAASDRMAGLEDGRLMAPIQYGTTAQLGAIVEQLVTEVYPAATIEWDDPAAETAALGRQLVAEEDRHGFLDELVASLGKVWFWDYRGVLVIRDAPDPSAPVATVAGGAGGVLVQAGRELSRKGAYNAVVATGEAADTEPPARAAVVDNDPASPTYFYGPFGPVPRFYSSSMLTTDEQAENAARAMLLRTLGVPYAVDFSAVPNPAWEPLDPVSIVTPGKLPETHVLSSLTIPLTAADPLQAKTREQTLVSIGVVS